MSDHTAKQNWWAQELMALRRKAQQEAGVDLRYLGKNDNLAGWQNVAKHLMNGVMTPGDVWREILAPVGTKPFHEVQMVAGSPHTKRALAGVALTPIEQAEMQRLGKDPEILEHVIEYRLLGRLKKIADNFERRLGTRDFGSKKVLEDLAFNFDNFPAWICYILGAGCQEVYDLYGEEGIAWLRENPVYGDALIRIGFPPAIIYPTGKPHE